MHVALTARSVSDLGEAEMKHYLLYTMIFKSYASFQIRENESYLYDLITKNT